MSERVSSGIIYVENNPSGSDVWEDVRNKLGSIGLL